MTNLEWLIKGSYIEKHDDVKGDKLIINCESGKLKKLSRTNQSDVLKWLLQEYKEPIKLTQFEYDYIEICDSCYGMSGFEIKTVNSFFELKEKGYFKGIKDTTMKIKDILENCEIVQDDYEF